VLPASTPASELLPPLPLLPPPPPLPLLPPVLPSDGEASSPQALAKIRQLVAAAQSTPARVE
jgi:hypothetical protein